MRCQKMNLKGQVCKKWGHHVLHVYTLPKPFGKKALSARGEVDMFRETVRARAGGYCEVPEEAWVEVCGLWFAHAGETAHHVKLRSQGGKHVASNGAWLCFDSHRYLHDHPQRGAELGLISMREPA